MIATFDRNGIRFQYPENWTIDLEEGDEVWTATVQSQELAFILLSLRVDVEEPAMLADEALEAIKEEYKELDVENREGSVCGVPASGYEIQFLTVDTPITCQLRAVESPAGPLLIMSQFSEYDREKNEIVIDAILRSLQFANIDSE